MESYYEREDEAVDSDFDFSKLSSASSLLPPPRKPFPWLSVTSFVVAAVVIGLAGVVGGWYAALNSTRVLTAKAAPAISPSAHDMAPIVPQAAVKNVEPISPVPTQHTPEPTASAAPTESVGVSQTTERTIDVDEIESSRENVASVRESVRDSKRVSQASEPARSASATTSLDVNKDAVATAVTPPELSENTPTIARSDQAQDNTVEPPETESPSATETPEAAETAEVAETSVAGAPPVSPSIPEELTREQVRDGFKSLYQQITQCAAGKHGVAKIQATLAGSGRVVFALVDGAFKGSPEGSCMARAVRKATFPQFSKSRLTVEFPYVL
jgi:hypothetical protein